MNPLNNPLNVAVVGTGFWARFQVRAWRELERQGLVRLVAICGKNRAEAGDFLCALGPPDVPIYTELESLLREIKSLDLVDLITTTPTHYSLARQVLGRRVAVIVQKPMAQTLAQAITMVREAQGAGVPLLVHENFRFQRPFLAVRTNMAAHRERLGPLVDVRVEWDSGAEDFLKGQPYFAEQPFLVNGEVGVHLIDVLRFLSGQNVRRVTSAHMHHGVDGRYRGEDLVHVTLDLGAGISAAYRAAFSAAHRGERPPQTFVRMTFQQGTIELGPDYAMTVTLLDRNAAGVTRQVITIDASPEGAAWTKEASLRDYQSWLGQWECTLPANRACVEFVTKRGPEAASATTGEDNLNVLATMFGAYLSSQHDRRIDIPSTSEGLEELARQLDAARIGYPEFPTPGRW